MRPNEVTSALGVRNEEVSHGLVEANLDFLSFLPDRKFGEWERSACRIYNWKDFW